jgi:hypothetical protein
MTISRRKLLSAASSTAVIATAGSLRPLSSPSRAQQTDNPPDLIVHNGKVTTLQSGRPEAQAFAVRGEKVIAVGGDAEIMELRTGSTRLVDAGGRRVILASTTIICTWYAGR